MRTAELDLVLLLELLLYLLATGEVEDLKAEEVLVLLLFVEEEEDER